jgi:hypothetical protein
LHARTVPLSVERGQPDDEEEEQQPHPTLPLQPHFLNLWRNNTHHRLQPMLKPCPKKLN